MAGKTRGSAKCSCERCLCSGLKRSFTSWKMPYKAPICKSFLSSLVFFFFFYWGVFFPSLANW